MEKWFVIMVSATCVAFWLVLIYSMYMDLCPRFVESVNKCIDSICKNRLESKGLEVKKKELFPTIEVDDSDEEMLYKKERSKK